MSLIRLVHAVVDPELDVVVHELAELHYAAGASPAHDLPAHLRAASALRRSGARLVIVQDDVNVLAIHHDGGGIEALLLPVGKQGKRTFDDLQGNKHAKMDLEACVVLPDGRFVAFGSGSTPERERLVVLDQDDAYLVAGSALYRLLRTTAAFAGSELNVEGAVVLRDRLRLFQRGNGAPANGLEPLNATADLDLAIFTEWLDGGGPLPELEGVTQYDLGHIGGVAYSFTDAATMADGRIAFVACAEASPDTVRDGEVLGCRFGLIDDDEARVAQIVHPDGRPAILKIEGIEARPGSSRIFDVVVDMDRPSEPSLLGRLEVKRLPPRHRKAPRGP